MISTQNVVTIFGVFVLMVANEGVVNIVALALAICLDAIVMEDAENGGHWTEQNMITTLLMGLSVTLIVYFTMTTIFVKLETLGTIVHQEKIMTLKVNNVQTPANKIGARRSSDHFPGAEKF